MHKRLYNKLYVNRNREDGSEKIFLGYQNNSTEYPLVKDKETYFHIPPYTEPVLIADSSLIIDGATGGLFPAVADRIFESRKGNGNTSNNGTPSEIPDGTWFCTWLYESPETGALRWYDRYFNPKKLNINLYQNETFNGTEYILNALPIFEAPDMDTVIYDVPSTMNLEPGVLYKYFHIGERTAENILTTFGGVSSEKLLFDIKDWMSRKASPSYPITITSSASSTSLFPNPKSSQVVLSSGLGFNHNQNVQAYIEWNQNYIPTHDFTLGFWCQDNNWNNCPSTQLIGNYSAKGGFGVFVDTQKTFPYFVIPEVKYGHLFFFNQDVQGFLDKVVISQLSGQSLKIPSLVAMDSNECVYVCSDSELPVLYKMDHGGNLLAKVDVPVSSDEELVSLMYDPIKDEVLLTTTKAIYEYSQLLIEIRRTNKPLTLSSNYVSSAFSYDTTLGTYSLSTIPNTIDLKFIENDEWTILTDNNVYKNGEMFLTFEDEATNLQIDPKGRLWVLHGTNNVSVFDPSGFPFQDPSLTFTVGSDTRHEQKHISFINVYDRSKLSNEWVSVIYYSDSRFMYTNTLDGRVSNIVDMSTFADYKVARQLDQDPYTFIYKTKGDFTSYENKRVFNSLTRAKKQLVIKASLKDKSTNEYSYKIHKASASIDDWDPNTWKHIILTHKNRTLALYINGVKQTELNYSGQYELSFDQQPSMFIGSPLGVSNGLNRETRSVVELFNGVIGDIKFYNYCIDPINFEMFLRAGIAAEDILWSLPIPSIGYIERIERMFKNKLPGSKSNFYNIKLSGTNITDLTTRALIEEQIKKIAAEISPVNVDLIKVTWIG